MSKTERMPSANSGQEPATARRTNRVPPPADETTRRRPDPDELPDQALEEVSGGARITKSDLIKL